MLHGNSPESIISRSGQGYKTIVGTIAAAAFGAVLYGVVTGDNIVSGLTGIIGKALGTSTG